MLRPLTLVLCLGISVPAIWGQTTRTEWMVEALARIDAEEYAVADSLLAGVIRSTADSLAGLAHHKRGLIAYFRADDAAAVAHFRRAIAVRDRIHPGPHNDRANSRARLGASLLFLDSLSAAARNLREAVAIFDRCAWVDTMALSGALLDLASVATRFRDKQLALKAANRAVKLRRPAAAATEGGLFFADYRAAKTLLHFDELAGALTYAARARRRGEALNDASSLADAYNLEAIVLGELGQVAESRQRLEDGLAVLTSARMTESYSAAPILLNLAEYHAAEGHHPAARDYDARARAIYREQGALREYAENAKYPENLLATGRYEEALLVIDDKLQHFGGELPPDSLDTWAARHSEDVLPRIDLLTVRAHALADRARRTEALAVYDEVLWLQDYLRRNVTTYASRSYLSSNLRPVFGEAIQLHYANYQADRDTAHLWNALALSERARAYSLLTGLQQAAEPPAVRNLLDRIAQLERRLARGDTTATMELDRVWLQLNLARDSVQRQPLAFPSPDREDIQAYLRGQRITLVEYFFGDNWGLVFTVDPTGDITAYPLAQVDGLTELATRWRDNLEASRYRRKSLRLAREQDSLDRCYLEDGLALTQLLLPAELGETLHLRTGVQKKRLIVVPDGPLHYLPLAALPLAPAALPLDYASLPYLYDMVELGHAHSMGILLETARRLPPKRSYDLVAFAPDFNAESGLPPLTHNVKEVLAVARLLPRAKTFVRNDASRQHFMESRGKGTILHLSSHGYVHPTRPELSFVAFAGRGEKLYFNDLRGLRMDNELAVLSACETALGELDAGEATLSFASALTGAGVRSTLTTLWRVDDRATSDLVTVFYEALAAGRDRTAALTQAQASLRAAPDHVHPYYWSGMVLYGPPTPVTISSPTEQGNTLAPVGYVLAVLLLGGGLVAWYYLRRK